MYKNFYKHFARQKLAFKHSLVLYIQFCLNHNNQGWGGPQIFTQELIDKNILKYFSHYYRGREGHDCGYV